MSSPSSSRDAIVDAAMTIVRDRGVARLTLDEAARVAGLSKGGVLYHFRSKDALIRGLVDREIGRCETLAERYYQDEPPGPYRWARAGLCTRSRPVLAPAPGR